MMHYNLTFRAEKHTVWRQEEEKEEDITRFVTRLISLVYVD